MGDPLVRLYMVRDTDMPLVQREVDAVNHWLQAGTVRIPRPKHTFMNVILHKYILCSLSSNFLAHPYYI